MQTSPFAKHRAFNKASDYEIQIDNIHMARSCGQAPRIEWTCNITVSVSKDSTLTARVLRTQLRAPSTMITMIFRNVALEMCFPAGGDVRVNGVGGVVGGGAPSKLRVAKVGWQPTGFFTVKIFR